MTDAITSAIAQHITDLTGAALEPKVISNTTHLLVPETFKHVDLTAVVEAVQPSPRRQKGTRVLGDVASLLTYCADQRAADVGYIYADVDARTLTAVFNDDREPTEAGWRDHRAVFTALLTDEAKKWISSDGKQFSQNEFAEFIEDNFADLVGEDASTLLTVATTIQAATAINFSSHRRLENGTGQLTYNEVVEAGAGANGEIKIPKTFLLGIRLFKNGEGFQVRARLKYKLHSGSVKFHFELDRIENVIEVAFKGYVSEVTEKSGYTVLLGKA